jgi:hypothetical protein
MRRAERLLGMCLLLAAALSACTALPPRDDARPAASIHPPAAPADSPAAPAAAGVQAVQESPERPAIAPEAPAPAQAGTLELLRDAAQYSSLPPDIQHDVIEGAETRLNIEQTPLALVRFALLLSLSEPNRQSDADTSARLRELLAQPPADTDSAGLAPLAQVAARGPHGPAHGRHGRNGALPGDPGVLPGAAGDHPHRPRHHPGRGEPP